VSGGIAIAFKENNLEGQERKLEITAALLKGGDLKKRNSNRKGISLLGE